MLVCNYCGRNFKNEYEKCPGCGSTSLKRISDYGEKIITTPPEGGYKLKLDNYKSEIKLLNIFKYIGIGLIAISPFVFILPSIIAVISSTSSGEMFISIIASLGFCIIPIFIGAVFLLISMPMQKKAKNNMERVKRLATTGTLLKNMPYELVPSNVEVNGRKVYCLQVKYHNGNGAEIPLISEPKYDNVLADSDGTADLLIDMNDNSNYYIDLEIY